MIPACGWHLIYKICLTKTFLHMDLTNLVYVGSYLSKSHLFVCILKIITLPCHCVELFLLCRNPLQILLQDLLPHFTIVFTVRSVLQLVLIATTTPYDLCQQPDHHHQQQHHHLKHHQHQRCHLLQHQPQQHDQ